MSPVSRNYLPAICGQPQRFAWCRAPWAKAPQPLASRIAANEATSISRSWARVGSSTRGPQRDRWHASSSRRRPRSPTHPSRRGEHRTDAQSGRALLWQLISDARHAGAHTFDFWAIAPTDYSDHKRAGYTRFKRSFGGQVKEYAGMWDLPIHAVKYSLYRAAKTFSNTYI